MTQHPTPDERPKSVKPGTVIEGTTVASKSDPEHGDPILYVDGLVVFIHGARPGDTVRARIYHVAPNYAVATTDLAGKGTIIEATP